MLSFNNIKKRNATEISKAFWNVNNIPLDKPGNNAKSSFLEIMAD